MDFLGSSESNGLDRLQKPFKKYWTLSELCPKNVQKGSKCARFLGRNLRNFEYFTNGFLSAFQWSQMELLTFLTPKSDDFNFSLLYVDLRENENVHVSEIEDWISQYYFSQFIGTSDNGKNLPA